MAMLSSLTLVTFLGVAFTSVTSQLISSVPRNVISTTNIRGPQNIQGVDRKRLGCVLQPVPNAINKYRVHLFSLGTSLDFYCAQGTIFYPDKCACDWPKDRNMVLPVVPTTIRPQTRPFPDRTLRPGRRPVIDNVRSLMTTTPEPCRFRADPDRNFYQEFVIGFGWSKRPCPIGTLYREETCKCDDIAPVSSLRCRAELYVPFDVMPIADGAGTSIPIGNNGNVDSVANAGRFDGSGRLTIWMYSNMDFGEQLTINLRFYDFPGGQEEQVLVSNCFDKELGSIEIATRPRKKEVVFRGNTAQSGPVEITLPYQVSLNVGRGRVKACCLLPIIDTPGVTITDVISTPGISHSKTGGSSGKTNWLITGLQRLHMEMAERAMPTFKATQSITVYRYTFL